MAAVTVLSVFGAPEKKSVTASTLPTSICYEVMGPDAMIFFFLFFFFFEYCVLSQLFHTSLSPSLKDSATLVAQIVNNLPAMQETRV